MFRLPRPLLVGLGIIPPALMILTEHPWLGAATFVVVMGAVLLRSGADPSDRPDPRQPSDLRVLESVAPGGHAADDERDPRQHDGLIHYPPRRL